MDDESIKLIDPWQRESRMVILTKSLSKNVLAECIRY